MIRKSIAVINSPSFCLQYIPAYLFVNIIYKISPFFTVQIFFKVSYITKNPTAIMPQDSS